MVRGAAYVSPDGDAEPFRMAKGDVTILPDDVPDLLAP
jgi:hypothetical protein